MQHELDTNAYYAFGIPAYLLLIAFELWLARKKHLAAYRFADTLGNVSCGLGEVVIGLFLGPYLLLLYDFGYEHLAVIHWPEASIIPWVLAFLVGDFCYWLYHRAGHSIAILWTIHGVHHQSEEFNFSVAARHPWLSDSYAFVFYIPVPLLGITKPQFFFAISMISFYAFFVHTRVLHHRRFYVLTTPATHIVHHAKNPRYLGKNLGAMFTLWDRLFRTHVEVDPNDAPVLGTRAGYRTHDGALSQWIHLSDLLDVARRARTWRDKILVFFKHPGWLPAGVSTPARAPAARPDAAIPGAIKMYAATHLTLIVAFAVIVLWFRDRHPLWMQVASALVILWSTRTLGGMLDGRPNALAQERLRLGGVAVFAIVLAGPGMYPVLGACIAAIAIASIGVLAITPGLVEEA